MSAPAIGTPVNAAIAIIVKAMPILVPILLMSVVKLDSELIDMPCTAALNRPYMTTKATSPSYDVMVIQMKRSEAHGIRKIMLVLRGPSQRSAISAGRSRPGSPTALRIRRKLRLVLAETWMTFVAKMLICVLVS